MSLRTKTLLLFLAFVLLPLSAVGVVSSIGTRWAVERAARTMLEESIRSVAAELERDPATAGPSGEGAIDSIAAVRLREAIEAGSLEVVPTEEILAPLARVRLAYIALVLLVGAAATVGFRVVTHRIFRSLDEFRRAVEQIAQGDFTPWLPPPGKDEVGWLSLALGRMADRMSVMMRSVEQSGRLAVVGEMAAHMAHEVRTPLSSIKMNLQLLDRSAKAGLVPANARVSIDTSLKEIARLEATVTRVLEFGSPGRASRRRCSLHDLINETADLLQSAVRRMDIVLRVDLSAESDWIWADGGRVKGVFLNLLVNALHELPEGGEISVETQLFLGEGGRQMVAAAVSDSGPGVPFALRDEIFHPFFTTKADGSGMGLPAALRTLREHGGDLYLSQRPGGRPGGCFVALFPLAPPDWSGESEVPQPSALGVPATPGGDWRRPARLRPRWARISQEQGTRSQPDDPDTDPASIVNKRLSN